MQMLPVENPDLPFYAMLNGNEVGPMTIDELAQAKVKQDTPIWQPGMADWIEARRLQSLRHLWSKQPSAVRSTAARPLVFDPTRPKTIGLVVLWCGIVSPLVFLVSAVSSIATMEQAGTNAEAFVNLLTLISIPVTFLTSASMCIGAFLWRSRHSAGPVLVLAGLVVEAIGGFVLFIISAGAWVFQLVLLGLILATRTRLKADLSASASEKA
jgi:hypothetical protein